MGDNKSYWQAMEVFAKSLRGEITQEQLEADPYWKWYRETEKKWIERAEAAGNPETIADVLKRLS